MRSRQIGTLLLATAVPVSIVFSCLRAEPSSPDSFGVAQTAPSSNQMTALLASMPVNTWQSTNARVPINSMMMNVAYVCTHAGCAPRSDLDGQAVSPPIRGIMGGSGPSSVMGSWGGGIDDPDDDAMIFWGGGHHDYDGNEVYQFSLKTLQWSLAAPPSDVAGWNGLGPLMPDGRLVSTHSYQAFVYLPGTHQMLTAGGQDANSRSFGNTQRFNVQTQTWVVDFISTLLGPENTVAQFNPADSNVYAISRSNTMGLMKYSFTSGCAGLSQWCRVGSLGESWSGVNFGGDIDPLTNMMWGTGGRRTNKADLGTGATATVATTGDQTCANANAPAFFWDPTVSKFLCWQGGNKIYRFDPVSLAWDTLTNAAGGANNPTVPSAAGQFGKTRYLRRYGAIISMTEWNDRVWVFKCDGIQC